MTYEYDVYLRQNCIVPICLLLFSVFLFFGTIHSLRKDICTFPSIKIWFEGFFLIVFLFLIIVNMFPLARGGLYLIIEKKNDVIQVSGEVEKLIEIDSITGAKYQVDNNNGHGEAIVVNGRKYFLTTYGDIQK